MLTHTQHMHTHTEDQMGGGWRGAEDELKEQVLLLLQ